MVKSLKTCGPREISFKYSLTVWKEIFLCDNFSLDFPDTSFKMDYLLKILLAHIKTTFNLFPHEGMPFLSGISSWTGPHFVGFPDSSVGKESAFNVGDPSSIPGWERPSVEGIGYPLQNYWACLVLSR